MKQQFLADLAGTFQKTIYVDNVKLVPDSATITVTKPGVTTVLVDAQSMTIAADGLMSYSLTTTHNDVVDDNYKATIAYVVGVDTFYLNVFYDVVFSKLTNIINDDHLINELGILKDNGLKVNGTATSGSSTTIVDLNLNIYPNDCFTGGLAYSITRDELRDVTDFVSSTGTITTTEFTGAIATDDYILTRSFTLQIIRAFEKLENDLQQLGRRPQLIIDSEDVKELHIIMSVAEVCKSLMIDEESMWWSLWKEYEIKASKLFKSLNLKYDENEDGIIDEKEERKQVNRRLVRA